MVAVAVLTIGTIRCTHPHPKVPGWVCNAVLFKGDIETVIGRPLYCRRCKLTTTIE